MLKEPDDATKCLYFTRRSLGRGRVVAWAFRLKCPKCGKGLMAKAKKRDKFYTCPECGFEWPEKEHDEKVVVEIKYTCPFCLHKGETTTQYKRRSFYGVKAYVFKCEKCGEKIGLTKKMKMPERVEEKINAFKES